jgi:hypothetical protein
MLAAVAVYSVLNLVIHTFVQPRFVGNSVALSTTVAFLSLAVWAFVLGPLGALLAVPMTLLVRALFIDPDPRARWTSALISSIPQGAPAPIHPRSAATRSGRGSPPHPGPEPT